MLDWVDTLCWFVVTRFYNRSTTIYVEGEPYLLRFYIKRNGKLPGVYLHRFLSGDKDRDLHNHPWKQSYSLILFGKYIEERLNEKGDVIKRVFTPGDINNIKANDFHRIDLLTPGVWSLFISYKQMQVWGFKDRLTGRFVDWKTYLHRKGRQLQDFDND